MERACQSCNALNTGTARFCRSCGGPVDGATELPAQRPHQAGPVLGSQPYPLTQAARDWGEMRLVFSLFGLLLGGFVVASVVARVSDIPGPQIDLVMSAIDAIIIAGFAAARPATVGPWLRNSGLDVMGALEILVAIAVFFSGAFVYFGVLRLLDLPLLRYLDEFRSAGWPLWSAYLLLCVYPAVFEEIAFRGFILGQLDKLLPAREALLVQAGMFSVLHISPIIFVSHFFMGLVLGILRRRRASLYPPMFVHVLWNAVVITQEALARVP